MIVVRLGKLLRWLLCLITYGVNSLSFYTLTFLFIVFF